MASTGTPDKANQLPQLYVYDHCPFCVRARHVLGFKGVKYNLVWLMNDDVEFPTSLVGRKMVPIFQPDGRDGPAMAESLDICRLVDGEERFGEKNAVRPASSRTDLEEWLDQLADPIRRLTRPRFANASTLPEFTFPDARAAYVRNHQIKDPPVSYEDNLAQSDKFISLVQDELPKLEPMIYSPEHISEGGFSYDDVVTFPRLRSLTIVKGLTLPPKVQEYLDYQSKATSIPLYYHIAM